MGVGVGDGVGVGVRDGARLIIEIWVTLLPPEPSMSNPSEPTTTSLGAGKELLGKVVPLTMYANISVTSCVWFLSAPVILS